MDTSTQTNLYDEVPYLSEPFPLSQPRHLSVIAQLFGINTTEADKASVLELGCGSGNNIIPLAFQNPDSSFIGVDSSQSQITAGKNLIAELGLKNIELVCLPVEAFSTSKQFDYIICHGMFSWVSEITQERILELCQASLNKKGLAYISYNTLPGWHLKSVIRDAMMFHTRNIVEPKQKLLKAKAYLHFLAFGTAEAQSPFHGILNAAAIGLDSLQDCHIFHDYLAEFNLPIYFSEFITRIEKHQLNYLCDADVTLLVPQEFSPEVQLALRKMAQDRVHLEQTTDYLRNQLFRRSIVCHQELKFARDPKAESIRNFFISSPLKSISTTAGTSTFEDPLTGNTLQTKEPELIKVLESLGSVSPMSTSYTELTAKCAVSNHSDLLGFLLRAYLSGVVFFDSMAPGFTTEVSARPNVSHVARELAKIGAGVVNLKHENITLNDFERKVVTLADGTRTKDELNALVNEDTSVTLELLAKNCLLLADN